MPSKAERRALGKAAAAKRAAAKRRRIILNRVGSVVAGLVLLGGIVVGVMAMSGSFASTPAAAPPAPTVSLDPALQTKPVVEAGTGTLTEVKVTTIINGTGPALANGQSVKVNYVGTYFATGKEFDASWTGGEPFTFVLGQGGVIPGWDQGLQGVPVGSRVQLDIPANLAYGDAPTGNQPAGPLRFVIDVLSATAAA
jgi:peptidylprolyl isomerase